uniref:Uncharacterized protein n=1 Tax=viral metagenome TaxID=1070528 RepID=A0A6H1ZYL7_9ZZZZ
MRNPTLHKVSIPASGRAYSKNVSLRYARTISVTARVKFHAAATGKATIEVYYSPDGTNFDTSIYGSFDIAVSAGNEKQASAVVTLPEHGVIKFAIYNTDAAQVLTWGKLWYTISNYPESIGLSHGDIAKDMGEEPLT